MGFCILYCRIKWFHVFCSGCVVRNEFRVNTMFGSSLPLSVVYMFMFYLLFVIIYICWYPTRFPYQMMFVWLTVAWRVWLVEQESPEFTSVLSCVCGALSLGFWVVLCIYFLSFCLFFSFWPLHCQSFTLRSLITHFWYSNFSRIVNYNTKYCPTRYKNHISVSFNCWARCIKSAARLYSQSSMFIDDFVIWHQWHLKMSY